MVTASLEHVPLLLEIARKLSTRRTRALDEICAVLVCLVVGLDKDSQIVIDITLIDTALIFKWNIFVKQVSHYTEYNFVILSIFFRALSWMKKEKHGVFAHIP